MAVTDRPHRAGLVGNTPHGRAVVANAANPNDTPPSFDGYVGLSAITEAVRSGELELPDWEKLNEADAKRLLAELQAGNIPPSEKVMKMLMEFDAENPGVLQAPEEPAPANEFDGPYALDYDASAVEKGRVQGTKGEPEPVKTIYNTHPAELPGLMIDAAIGTADAAKTMVGGALGQIGGGAVGAAQLVAASAWDVVSKNKDYSSEDFVTRMDQSANTINAIADGINWVAQPWTGQGQDVIETVAYPFMKLDTAARDFAEEAAGGDPEKAAALYSIIVGAPELFGLKGMRATIRPENLAKAQLAAIKKLADERGIKLTQNEMFESVVDAALRHSQGTRAANAGTLRDALISARNQSRVARINATARAQGTHAAIQATDVTELAKALNEQLRAAGYDLDQMPAVTSALDDLMNIDTRSPLTGPREIAGAKAAKAAEETSLILPVGVKAEAKAAAQQAAASHAVTLQEIYTIRNRMEKAIRPENAVRNLPEGLNPNISLRIVDRALDDLLEMHYVNDMIDGSPQAIAAWRAADDARVHHNRRFHEDRVLEKLMDREADPTQIRRFLMGQSATSPASHAVRTVQRIKEILGPDSPAVRGITLDYTHELIRPLLQAEPNMTAFIRNIDTIKQTNAPLWKELGMDKTGINELRNFAVTAQRLAPSRAPFFSADFWATALARFGVGHAIAKAGLRVGIAKRLFSSLFGVDSVSQKQILFDAAGVAYGAPVIPKGSNAMYNVLEGAIVADWERIERERKQ